MYFDFEDYRPDTPTLDRSLTQLEIVLLTVVVHLLILISMLAWPHLPFVKAMYAAQEQKLEEAAPEGTGAHCATARSSCSSRRRWKSARRCRRSWRSCRIANRRAQTMEKAPDPKNDMAFSRGNSAEKIVSDAHEGTAAAFGAAERAGEGERRRQRRGAAGRSQRPAAAEHAATRSSPGTSPRGIRRSAGRRPACISEAVRNVQKYSQGESLQNVQGNGDFGPSIQFDTKGVDFGPWLRRFVAQIRRNWFVPYAAMSLRGHVVLSFKVHRDGSITDLQVLQPSSIDAFTKSAFNAIKLSNPTVPLPLEFPDENAPFIVTFYFNETPPGGGRSSPGPCRPARSRSDSSSS